MSDTVNLLAFGTDVIGSADTGGSGSGGHTIEDPSGTDMEQRSNLQFTDAVVADDSTNNRTEISIVRELMQAEFDELTPEEQNRGVIVIKDANPPYLPSDNAVSVTADGVKTYGTLLTELYAKVDRNKIGVNSSLRLDISNTVYSCKFCAMTTSLIIFSTGEISTQDNTQSIHFLYALGSSSSIAKYGHLNGTSPYVDYTSQTASVPENGAVFTLYYNIVASASSSGSGGHTIENTNGTDLPQEDNLQFVGVYTEDDSENDRTKVNIVREMEKSEMDALSNDEKKGFIRTTDEPDYPFVGTDSVSVTADGVKTYAQLLNELYALVDKNRLTAHSYLMRSNSTIVSRIMLHDSTSIILSNIYGDATAYTEVTFCLASTSANSFFTSITTSKSGNTVVMTPTDASSAVPTSGNVITLYYDVVAKISVSKDIDASDVTYGSGSVKDVLDNVTIAESVTLTKQSSAIDATTLSAKSKAGNLHFFGYFHNNASIASGTTIYTFADHLPSVAQTILALGTSGSSASVASVTIYEDGRVYVASEMAVGYWVLVGEVWE